MISKKALLTGLTGLGVFALALSVASPSLLQTNLFGSMSEDAPMYSKTMAPMSQYSDVPADAWFAPHVAHLQRSGLISPENTGMQFRPGDNMNRAEAAEFILKVAGRDASKVKTDLSYFCDVDASAWYNASVFYMGAEGLISGYEDSSCISERSFGPDQAVTRAQALKMLLGAFEIDPRMVSDEEVRMYGDVSGSDWFAPYIFQAAQLGLISPDQNGMARPNDMITRAEMAKLAGGMLKSFAPARNWEVKSADLENAQNLLDRVQQNAKENMITMGSAKANFSLSTTSPEDEKMDATIGFSGLFDSSDMMNPEFDLQMPIEVSVSSMGMEENISTELSLRVVDGNMYISFTPITSDGLYGMYLSEFNQYANTWINLGTEFSDLMDASATMNNEQTLALLEKYSPLIATRDMGMEMGHHRMAVALNPRAVRAMMIDISQQGGYPLSINDLREFDASLKTLKTYGEVMINTEKNIISGFEFTMEVTEPDMGAQVKLNFDMNVTPMENVSISAPSNAKTMDDLMMMDSDEVMEMDPMMETEEPISEEAQRIIESRPTEVLQMNTSEKAVALSAELICMGKEMMQLAEEVELNPEKMDEMNAEFEKFETRMNESLYKYFDSENLAEAAFENHSDKEALRAEIMKASVTKCNASAELVESFTNEMLPMEEATTEGEMMN